MVRSPLGKYSALAAAIAALGILGVYVTGQMYALIILSEPAALGSLKDLALIAAGAVFASGAVATNGAGAIQDQLAAVHARLDSAGIAPAAARPPD